MVEGDGQPMTITIGYLMSAFCLYPLGRGRVGAVVPAGQGGHPDGGGGEGHPRDALRPVKDDPGTPCPP